MQVDNTQRAGIITVGTVVGAGAGAAIGHYMPLVNNKGKATSDCFVKEVAKEMTAEKAYNLLHATAARDYLDTVYPAGTKTYATKEQQQKFFNLYGDFLGIKEAPTAKKGGRVLRGAELRDKLFEIVDNKIAENGKIEFAEDKKTVGIFVEGATKGEAEELIRSGFKNKKLVKAGSEITEEGLASLKAAMKTVKNARMIKGGLLAGLAGLAVSTVLTCQKDN